MKASLIGYSHKEKDLKDLYKEINKMHERKETNVRFVDMTCEFFQDPFVLYDRKVHGKKYCFQTMKEVLEFLKGEKVVIVSMQRTYYDFTINMYVHDAKPSILAGRLINVQA